MAAKKRRRKSGVGGEPPPTLVQIRDTLRDVYGDATEELGIQMSQAEIDRRISLSYDRDRPHVPEVYVSYASAFLSPYRKTTKAFAEPLLDLVSSMLMDTFGPMFKGTVDGVPDDVYLDMVNESKSVLVFEWK